MKIWSIVGPHFMQAACHKDRIISKKAVTCIHDAVTALLNEQAELPHFHFNEALIKPFENLLCLELCDSDVQVNVYKQTKYNGFINISFLGPNCCLFM